MTQGIGITITNIQFCKAILDYIFAVKKGQSRFRYKIIGLSCVVPEKMEISFKSKKGKTFIMKNMPIVGKIQDQEVFSLSSAQVYLSLSLYLAHMLNERVMEENLNFIPEHGIKVQIALIPDGSSATLYTHEFNLLHD